MRPFVANYGRVIHRLYFVPGMFGFGRLASYDYFDHLERAIGDRLRQAGDEVESWVLNVSPTASVRRRAARLAELVGRTCDDHPERPGKGPIHLVGHSTGGLDARLVASPSAHLPCSKEATRWLPRLASVTTLNTPHFGTPLASFFATVSGQRILYALSALTFIALSLGSPPLAAVSSLVMVFGRLDRRLGLDLGLLDRSTEGLLRVLDDARSKEVRVYLEAIKEDQGAIVQVMPEAMDLFQAGVENRQGVLYQSVATLAPAPTISGLLGGHSILRTLTNPWRPLSSAIFATLYGITSRIDERYPCAAPQPNPETEAMLQRVFGRTPAERANDGVVPLRSQLWGKLVWAGYADHLDVLGHFDGARGGQPPSKGEPRHVDWLTSGADFDRQRFEAMADAIASGMLAATR